MIDALIEANQADLDAFKRGIEPIAVAGKLGALLAQFPASFHDSPASRVHLAALLRAFGGHQVAVELRHRSWSDHADETQQLLDAFNAAWVWIDELQRADCPDAESDVEADVPETMLAAFPNLRGESIRRTSKKTGG